MCNLYENDETLFDIWRLIEGGLLIKVRYKNFSGQFVYYIEDYNMKEYIESLKCLDNEEVGEFLFSDMDSESYIKFEKIKYGHMIISGLLGSPFQENYLIFKFPADQTIIRNLIHRLLWIAYADTNIKVWTNWIRLLH